MINVHDLPVFLLAPHFNKELHPSACLHHAYICGIDAVALLQLHGSVPHQPLTPGADTVIGTT